MPRAPFQVLVFPYRKNFQNQFEFALLLRADEDFWQGIAGGGAAGQGGAAANQEHQHGDDDHADQVEHPDHDEVAGILLETGEQAVDAELASLGERFAAEQEAAGEDRQAAVDLIVAHVQHAQVIGVLFGEDQFCPGVFNPEQGAVVSEEDLCLFLRAGTAAGFQLDLGCLVRGQPDKTSSAGLVGGADAQPAGDGSAQVKGFLSLRG